MKLFRIEHSKSLDGMWTVKVDDKAIVEHLTDKRLAEMPMPHHERYRFENKVWRCAVGDMESMHHWFSEQDIREMMDFDFRLISFESDDFIIEPHQILFNCASRRDQVDLTNEFLSSITKIVVPSQVVDVVVPVVVGEILDKDTKTL